MNESGKILVLNYKFNTEKNDFYKKPEYEIFTKNDKKYKPRKWLQ